MERNSCEWDFDCESFCLTKISHYTVAYELELSYKSSYEFINRIEISLHAQLAYHSM